MAFALIAMTLVAASGSAIDYGRLLSERTRASAALDGALLAAAVAVKADKRSISNVNVARGIARNAVNDFMRSQGFGGRSYEIGVDVAITRLEVNVTADMTGRVPTSFMMMAGVDEMVFTIDAASKFATDPFIDITLLVDTSASMALGATAGDIQRLQARWGCAFACHDNPGRDSYAWAKSNGVKLRYDFIHEAVESFMDYLDTYDPGNKVRVQLYGFDNTLYRLQGFATNLDRIRNNLPTAPVTSSELAGATRFWEFKDQIPGLIPKSGDGSTRAKARQVVLMLTDGVQDPNRTWTWNLPLRDYVREFDWSVCDAVRAKGATMGVVNVPYLPLPWDWGYNATLDMPSMLGRAGKKRIDDVTHALQECGGEFFISAETPDEIGRSFQTLFDRVLPVLLAR